MEKKETAAASPMGMGGVSSMDEEVACNSTTMRASETCLRLLSVPLCISALLLMLKNSQQNEYGSVAYTDIAAFRYLVNVNGICAGYSLLSALFIAAMPRHYSTISRAWTFFFLDQVVTYMIVVGGAMSTEVLYLAEYGGAATTWSSACGSFGRFCHKLTASIAITYASLGCYVLLSLMSSYKLFTNYDAPPIRSPITAIHIVAFHASPN
ncbi:CASP-like protein 2A2 [Arachis stenosperma]|uniref:CASP-like protein 2A2 n=1 Tax=Arachis stenosperma TaxID=217475 RepID=UPI0025ACF77D|nr:CASP-like protein 2A2 [Arachis stenosperma]